MCPKFKDGICEVVGIKPEYIECADESYCYKNSEYEQCRLYIVDRSYLDAAA